MKKMFKKVVSLITAFTLVFSFNAVSSVNAADYTLEEMVKMTDYNVALKKSVNAYPSLQEGNLSVLTDGKFTPGGDHAATTFGTAGTYYVVDLGKVYDASTLDTLVVGYKEKNDGDTPVNGYDIQYSANGLDYTTVKTVPGADVKAQITETNVIEQEDISGIEGKVRFVKILYKDVYTWGIQVTEIAVLSTAGAAQEVDADTCDDAASVTVDSPDFNTITYSIQRSDSQVGYKYLVYLINGSKQELIGTGVDAGTEYTVDGIESGSYKLLVVSCYNGAASEGIESDYVSVADVSNVFGEMKNIANRSSGYPAQVTEASYYEGHTSTTAQKALDGRTETGEGNNVCLRVAAGGNQSVVVDLGDYYTPSEMDYLLVAHTNVATCPANTKVEFSQDGESYTQVGNKTGYEFKAAANKCGINRIALDTLSDYTAKAVRFVKLTFSAGGSNWGYCINEIGLIATTDIPTIVGSNILDPADIIIGQDDLQSLTYQIVASEGQDADADFVVSINGEVVNRTAKAGTVYKVEHITDGMYEFSASTNEDGWLSKGIKREFKALGYKNYISTALNVACHKFYRTVATTDSDNIESDYWIPIGQNISGGVDTILDGVWKDGRHHFGYLQTRPDSKTATVEVDLSSSYPADKIHSIISVYDSKDTMCTDYEIEFSGDGENFEKVYAVSGEEYKQFIEAIPNISKYSQETVRYVRLKMLDGPFKPYYNADGSKNYEAIGYLLREFAVMHEDSVLPDQVKEVEVTSPADETISVSFTPLEGTGYTYNLYIDDALVANFPTMPDEPITYNVSGGLHTVKVLTAYEGYESLGSEYSININSAPTTKKIPVKPTTTAKPTTAKQTTARRDFETVTEDNNVPSNLDVKAPGKATVTKATKKKSAKKLSVKLKKVAGAVGYKVFVYKTKKNANKKKGAIATKVTKAISVSINSKKFKKAKTLFVRARAYVMHPEGFEVYGAWSAVKKVKIKK